MVFKHLFKNFPRKLHSSATINYRGRFALTNEPVPLTNEPGHCHEQLAHVVFKLSCEDTLIQQTMLYAYSTDNVVCSTPLSLIFICAYLVLTVTTTRIWLMPLLLSLSVSHPILSL